MGVFINLIGKRFGRLVVISTTHRNKFQQIMWKSNCDCGNVTNVITQFLISGHTKSCGCLKHDTAYKNLFSGGISPSKAKLQKNTKNMLGIRYGRLVVIARAKKNKYGNGKYICKCDCGKRCTVLLDSLRCGRTNSCGCIRSERATRHIIGVLVTLKTKGVSKASNAFFMELENKYNVVILREIELENRLFDGRWKNNLIEVDGSYWHRTKFQKANDRFKNRIATRNGFILYRFVVDSVRDVPKLIIKYKRKLDKLFYANIAKN